MTAVSRFVGTTILGGVLFLTPIVVLALILNKAYVWPRRGLQPVTTLIPDRFASATDHDGDPDGAGARARLFSGRPSPPDAAGAESRGGLESRRPVEGPRLRVYEAGRSERARSWRNGGASGWCWPNSATPGASACRPTPARTVSSPCSSPIRRTRCRALCFSSPPTASGRPTSPLASAMACLRRCGAGAASLGGGLDGAPPVTGSADVERPALIDAVWPARVARHRPCLPCSGPERGANISPVRFPNCYVFVQFGARRKWARTGFFVRRCSVSREKATCDGSPVRFGR